MRFPRSADLLFGQLGSAAEKAGLPWGTDHESIAVTVKDGGFPLSELAGAARRLAESAVSAGLKEDDWCVVRLDQPLDILVAVAGLTAVGVVPVLLSAKLDVASAAAALEPVTVPLHLLITQRRAAEVPRLSAAGATSLVWEDLVSDPRVGTEARVPAHGVERAPDAPYLVTHTSGTTGVPKLAVHTRNSFYQQSVIQARILRTLSLRGYLAAAISPVHVRTLSGLLSALRLRLNVLLLASEEPDVVAGQLERWRPHYLETHPNTFVRWEELADTGVLSSVRLFLGTFDAMHPPTMERLLAGSRRRMPLFAEVYAQSELGPVAFRMKRRRGGRRESVESELAGHRVGRSLPGYSRIRIVDEAGNPLGANQPGRIQVRSKGFFAGYLNFPEKFEENRADGGWWDSGDWGTKSRFGNLRLLDRQVERLDQAASGIALEDVLLGRLPEAVEIVVLETHGALVPVVATRTGMAVPSQRWAQAVDGLPELASPRHASWSAIPRTATGKVRRELLRQQLGFQAE
ncbi:AMP-binding protein [Streptomyces sp. NPDC029674]|uniref:AMP-binding protein n=1 Tax=Streptomyces sp. NPDC029674 TaxID=3365297 RepID=UPI00384AAA9A